MKSEIFKLLGIGFGLGWGPCLGFCGSIFLPYVAGTQSGWKAGLTSGLVFSIGRIFALVTFGGIASYAFLWIDRYFRSAKISFFLYLGVAIFIISMGIFLILGRQLSNPFWKVLKNYKANACVLGFLVGFVPCLPFLSMLTYVAAKSTGVYQGILYALCFGVGTITPLIILSVLAGFFSGIIAGFYRAFRILRSVCGGILIFLGLEFLYRIIV